MDVSTDKPFFGRSSKQKLSHAFESNINAWRLYWSTKKAHDLFDIGAITKEQYDDLQKNIFDNLNGMRKWQNINVSFIYSAIYAS